MFKSSGYVAAVAMAVGMLVSGGAGATAVGPEMCGNKGFSATQDSHTLSYTDSFMSETGICGNQGGNLGNSTGGNSLISAAGWTSGSEVQGNAPDGNSGQGDGNLTLTITGNSWAISNPNNYQKVGLSLKHGNGFIFYVLDTTKFLNGDWFTFDNGSAGDAFSHHNAWYKPGDGGGGNPPNVVPLPAAGWLLIAGLGGLGAMRRFRKS